jgi:hypothetical protein
MVVFVHLFFILVLFLLFGFVVLGIEPRASHMVSKHCYYLSHVPALLFINAGVGRWFGGFRALQSRLSYHLSPTGAWLFFVFEIESH